MGGAGKMELSVTCSTTGFSSQNISYRNGEQKQFPEELQLPIEFGPAVVQTGSCNKTRVMIRRCAGLCTI